jgi:hypothetical protein
MQTEDDQLVKKSYSLQSSGSERITNEKTEGKSCRNIWRWRCCQKRRVVNEVKELEDVIKKLFEE